VTDGVSELDPVTIRKALGTSRKAEQSWDEAWLAATGTVADSKADECRWPNLREFQERHFRAAYHNAPSSRGRLKVAELDVSAALDRVRPTSNRESETNSDRCRSGDGCDRLATRGTFGKHWCDYHGEELERLSVKMDAAVWGDTYRGTPGVGVPAL
jgi:hypothetical protein